MKQSFEIFYHPEVISRDIPKLSVDIRKRIKFATQEKLTTFPHEFGLPLRRTLKGYWKLRVGDYRVIYKIEQQVVSIFRIGHRREIYQNMRRL